MKEKILKTKDNWSPDVASESKSMWAVFLSLILPAAFVVVVLLAVISNQGDIENAVSNITFLLPVGFAFSAGMVASVNPCGVVMLTAFAFQRQGVSKVKRPWQRIGESLLHTLMITISFLVIFLGVGALISAGGQAVLDIFPYAGFLVGVGMTGLGIWLVVKKKTLSLNVSIQAKESENVSLWSDLLFGLSYAVASLSCTLPIFLVVAGNALSAQSTVGAFTQFGAYALGMGTAVLVVILGSVLFKRGLARWLRRVTPFVHRLSSLFLTAAGIYVMIYWVSTGNIF